MELIFSTNHGFTFYRTVPDQQAEFGSPPSRSACISSSWEYYNLLVTRQTLLVMAVEDES